MGADVLVTGAAGFVGGHVARRLAEGEHLRVRALVRDPARPPLGSLEHPRLEVVQGDILSPGSLAAACAGARAVFHAAVDFRTPSAARARATIVEGTRNVLRAAGDAGVRHLLYMSSLSVYYGAMGRAPRLDAGTRLVPCGDLYSDAKIAAEEALRRAAAEGPVVTVLRAAAVYGPGSTQWSAHLAEQARRGTLYLPGNGRFPFPYVYIDNLVDAVVAALRRGAVSGTYDILDGRVPFAQFAAPVVRLTGGRARALPIWSAYLAALAGAAFSRVTGRWVQPSPAVVRAMWLGLRGRDGQWQASSAAAQRDLGWAPCVDLDEGMRRTLAWLRTSGDVAHAGGRTAGR